MLRMPSGRSYPNSNDFLFSSSLFTNVSPMPLKSVSIYCFLYSAPINTSQTCHYWNVDLGSKIDQCS